MAALGRASRNLTRYEQSKRAESGIGPKDTKHEQLIDTAEMIKTVYEGLTGVRPTGGALASSETGEFSVVPWSTFLRAARQVATWESEETGRQSRAFDLSMFSSESFACLALEMWASEILKTHGEDNSFSEELHHRSWKRLDNKHSSLTSWLKEYPMELYMVWMLLAEVLDADDFRSETDGFGFVQRPAFEDSVASRQWYSTASQLERTDDPMQHHVVARLPGNFSVRGDWFLGVAEGSLSGVLADRALDLLSSRRANVTRLQHGLGLPVRDDVALSGEDPMGQLGSIRLHHRDLRTKVLTWAEKGQDFVSYGDLCALGAQPEDESSNFRWLFRSGLRGYDRHTRVWRKWLHRMLTGLQRIKRDNGERWLSGFNVYDSVRKHVRKETRRPTKSTAADLFEGKTGEAAILTKKYGKITLEANGSRLPVTLEQLESWPFFLRSSNLLFAALLRATSDPRENL